MVERRRVRNGRTAGRVLLRLPLRHHARGLALLLDHRDEGLDERGVEHAPAHPADLVGRVVVGQRGAVGAVFRIIPYEIKGMRELGLPRPLCEKLCAMPKGLVLVTGATGSGKSTTLAAMIEHINQVRHDHVVTIEDPIEFVYRNKGCLFNQREVIHLSDVSFDLSPLLWSYIGFVDQLLLQIDLVLELNYFQSDLPLLWV